MEMAIAYLKHWFRAKSRHGIHSPFVFRLVEDVFRSKGWIMRREITAVRKLMTRNHSKVEIHDFGAGSRVSKSNTRRVSAIVRISSTSLKEVGMLQRLAVHLNCENVLELGTNLGLATAALAAAPSVKQLISLEGDPALADLARKNIESLKLNATIITGAFDDNLKSAIDKFDKIDMAYMDGNHRKRPTLEYFKAIANKIEQNGVIVVGDIHWSKEMEEAWETIKAIPEARVTIDIFSMGLVFFRKEMTPEHFIINYR